MGNLLRNIRHLVAGNIVRSTVMTLLTLYIIRNTSVGDFGVYSTVLAFSSITSAFVNFGLNTYLVREASKDIRVFLPLLKAVTRARFLLFTVSEVILYVLLTLLGYNETVILLTLIFALDPMLSFLLDSLYSLLYIEERTQLVSLAESGRRALLFALVLLIPGKNLTDIVVSYPVADAIVLAAVVILSAGRLRELRRISTGNVPSIGDLLRRNLFFSLQTLTGLFFWNVDVMLVSKLLGATATGFYNVGATIFKAIYFLPQSFGSVLLPKLSRAHYDGNFENARNLILESAKTLLLVAIGIVVYSQTSLSYYIPILFGDKYSPAMELIGPMSLIVLFYFPAFLGQNVLIALDREKKAVNSLILANATNFLLNLVFIERYGLLGAVYATVLSQAVFFASTVYYLRDVIVQMSPMDFMWRDLVVGSVLWAVTGLTVSWLNGIVKPYMVDNLYFLTFFLLHRTLIKGEKFIPRELRP
ncbi:polysaccharide biosynthesis C-terminal domain-containing protein [Thermococcus sp.]|uniref:oligosaccharide flippase family protein n=1 Tax=Thermococcus sp. TaxID=35749 RepID=UPI00260184F3|nr:polysaccharide biosynthesis C-terminal domain-containing protein [Thermococcus sp.]